MSIMQDNTVTYSVTEQLLKYSTVYNEPTTVSANVSTVVSTVPYSSQQIRK